MAASLCRLGLGCQFRRKRYSSPTARIVEPNSVVHDGKEAESTQDQDAANAFPFPGDDQADHHRQHRGQKQIDCEWLGKGVGDAFANGEGGNPQ
ncbi:MAG: hypothetical protein ACLQNE_12075 [Thermoguttaceae bacterium]